MKDEELKESKLLLEVEIKNLQKFVDPAKKIIEELELKENKEKVQQLSNMINNLQIRNIQIEAVIADRALDISETDKEQVKQDAEGLYGKL